MLPWLCSMSLISPNFDVMSIIFSQFWPGAFSQNCWKKPCLFCLFDLLTFGHLCFAIQPWTPCDLKMSRKKYHNFSAIASYPMLVLPKCKHRDRSCVQHRMESAQLRGRGSNFVQIHCYLSHTRSRHHPPLCNLNEHLSLYVTYLNVSTGIDLVNSIARSPPSFAVEVVTLYKYTVITHTPDPDITLPSVI